MENKRKKTSGIWSFFEAISKETAVCNMCKCKFSLKGSISNLKKHIQRKHPTVNLNYCSERNVSCSEEIGLVQSQSHVPINENTPVIVIQAGPSPSSSSCTGNVNATEINLLNPNNESSNLIVSPRPASVKKQASMASFIPKKITLSEKNKIDDAIMKVIAWDLQPFSIVEDRGFQNLMKICAPSYKIPSRKYFSKTLLPSIYEQKKVDLKSKLQNEALSVTLTTDSWTSPVNDSFTAVTVHYINELFEMKAYLLECAEANESHTSQYLASEILRVVDEWGLSDKVLIVITDNASNITSAITNILKWKHFGCYAHKINLIVQDGLLLLDALIKKVKGLVTFFKRSNAAVQKLLKYQEQTGIKQPKKLLQDVATRWNSTFFMLERFILLEDAVKHTLALTDSDLPKLTVEEWEICKQTCIVLEPFAEVTTVISSESYVSASKVIPITRGLKSTVKKLSVEVTNASVKNLVANLLQGIDKRFPNLEKSKSFSICSFLDPRIKHLMFEESSTVETTKKHVIELVCGLIKKNTDHVPEEPALDVQQQKKLSIWDDVDETISKARPVGTAYSQAVQEVQRYFDDKPIQRKEDPLAWWKDHVKVYPNLATLARTHLAMVATSVPCERMFSKAGIILSDRRTRLQTRKVKELIFLNANSSL